MLLNIGIPRIAVIKIYITKEILENKSGHMTPLCAPFFFLVFSFPLGFLLFLLFFEWTAIDPPHLTEFLLCCVILYILVYFSSFVT